MKRRLIEVSGPKKPVTVTNHKEVSEVAVNPSSETVRNQKEVSKEEVNPSFAIVRRRIDVDNSPAEDEITEENIFQVM